MKETTTTLIKWSRSYSSVIVHFMVIIFIVISINITSITTIIFFTTIAVLSSPFSAHFHHHSF
ncbi:hypothetical protein DPMN_190617 [Dreissena polymorpha]|uniref:Uncharacterized protein n=1 Tax=Dreissena polymorpha TaxID=45954 RepID=A0A9D3XZI8_DREPO|nr:hypothetical protein DPMN_190617 [Dreissena polymorpha]